ncbi:hypothetical protein [Streptomyces parvulus]|uniref:hypothetical protein n=1 Tax=Streptomyces parvulus TaxID=146923 RepID=UPI0036F61BCD
MISRTDTIAAVLRRPRLTRPVVAHELRERLVQGLVPGGTTTDWTATVPQLAEAIATALEQAEQKDTRRRTQRPAGESTARAEILAVLESAGYNAAASAELLGRAHREPRTTPPDSKSLRTLAGGHALVVEHGTGEIHGACQCARRLGLIPAHALIDILAAKWEHHVLTEVPTR